VPVRVVNSLEDVPGEQWNRLDLGGNPFLRHEFLLALEREHCVGRARGWLPNHLLLEEGGRLTGAVPLYRKSHSWGEFVFDFSWARAYDEAGLAYYPKLVSMTPFTPAAGARLLVAQGASGIVQRRELASALLDYARSEDLSSAHLLFVSDQDRAAFEANEVLWRKDCQFHWHNRGYATFADFLATFRSEKRKKALRERRRIEEAGITFRTLHGGDISDDLWDVVFGFSQATFLARGNDHYLTASLFKRIGAALPDSVMVKLAERHGQPIATAIFFSGGETLYGRYWGSVADFHSLHFETCYYQGIEYCIERGLQRFEPGTQGEHKVPRGFEPATTWSAHWIADPRFRRAIAQYLDQERAAVDRYAEEVKEHVPFRAS
jgi:uncharacterized protein